jgi:ceramide glucosyltransferase
MTTLLVALGGLAIVSLGFTWVTQATALRALRRRPPAGLRPLPPISILKPLKGLDDGLYENLASFARLDYPRFELLLGVASADDPAAPLCRRLIREFPRAGIRLVVCPPGFGKNPKVSTLVRLAAVARHDLVLISDSNVRARAGYLEAMAREHQREGVGLVCNPVAGVGEKTFGALLENLQLGGFVSSSICAAFELAGHACVVGKSMLFRLSDLERVGGFYPVRDVLAEDYVLGRRFQRAGLKVALSSHVVETVNERWTAARFIERHLRWAQMRRRLNPMAYAGEPLLNPTPFLAALLACALAGGLRELAVSSLVLLAAKALSDIAVLRALRGAAVRLRDLPAIFFKDLVALGIWLVGFFRRTICWRGHSLRLESGSRLLEADETLAPELAEEAA